MPRLLHHIMFICLFICSATSTAQHVIKIGVGNFPPFFIEKEMNGIFIEVTDEIFKQLPQYKLEYIFMSNHRILHEINYGKLIDVACNVFPSSQVNVYLSDPVFRYRDVAISLKSNQFKVNKITDLQGKSIAAYQGATELLGAEFKQMAEANDDYAEYPHPKETTHLIVSGEKEIRIGDINIFEHDLNNKYYKKNINVDYENFNVHYLFPYVYSHMAFKDQTLKDAVNKVIKELNLNGSIEKIYAKHKMK
ncbi:MAG: transporter substrate-binding domain-containing protein [Colwellia sp.]|nr:transporter substrate-binding domain-containing protein [Colwellia sp.]